MRPDSTDIVGYLSCSLVCSGVGRCWYSRAVSSVSFRPVPPKTCGFLHCQSAFTNPAKWARDEADSTDARDISKYIGISQLFAGRFGVSRF